jgi:phage baseplate assembly protein W
VNAKRDLALGIDLALTRFAGEPSAVPLGSADSWGSLDLQAVRGGATGRDGDALGLGAVRGRENLAQALMLRLLTKEGALAALGHPGYGSRLVTLIGGTNDAASRNLARLYTLSALLQEPRIRKVLDLRVDVVPGQPQSIRVSFSVQPKFDDEPLSLGLEMAL